MNLPEGGRLEVLDVFLLLLGIWGSYPQQISTSMASPKPWHEEDEEEMAQQPYG